jgi:peroxiredoxin
VLFAAFALVVGVALARGRRPDCNCFGRLHSAQIGRWTLARNLGLAVLAGLVAWRAVPLGWFETAAAVGAVALAVQAWLWLELLRRYGRALRRISELESEADATQDLVAGDAAPPFVLPDLDGRLVALESLLGPDGLVLLFTDPRCGACDLALEEAAELPAGLVAITTGPRDEAAAKAEEHGLPLVLLDARREIAPLYHVSGVPTAVRLTANGTVAESATGHVAVAALLRASDAPLLVAGGSR